MSFPQSFSLVRIFVPRFPVPIGTLAATWALLATSAVMPGQSSAVPGPPAPAATLPATATPVLSPPPGAYTRTKTVRITDASAGATIYYTLHGATPTTKSTKYTGPIKVESTLTILAIAVAGGHANSAVAGGRYTINLPPAALPVFAPPAGLYHAVQKVRITDATTGATIFYTTDGTAPTSSSATYGGEIQVDASETLRAMATAPQHKASTIASAHYSIEVPVAAPVFHPAGGNYSSAQNVTISDATQGATIYYTTDGSTPSTKSAQYTAPIPVPVSSAVLTLKAIAVKSGDLTSAVATANYTITPLVATPVFYPASGTYSETVSVAVTDSTKSTTIHYTTNGKTPTPASSLYTSPIDIASDKTIQAIAVTKTGEQSAVGSATYTITAGVTAPPVVSTTPALNGAVIARLSSTTAGATIYYTLDGSTPTASSAVYLAPFLVDSPQTLNAMAMSPGNSNSPVTVQVFDPNIAAGTLVWSDEFTGTQAEFSEPNPKTWTYDTGNSGFGNNELENYCAWGSNASPCSTADPNAYVGADGYLHIVARRPSTGVYTSARLKTQGLFSFRYGRLEVRAKVPEAQGFWPAAWLLGNNIATVNWPACGEQDDLERVNAALTPDWNEGSVHGSGFTGGNIGQRYSFPAGQTAAEWHTYGMIWTNGSVSYYIDDPASPYVTFTPASIKSLPGAVWPFDMGQANFILLNLAIGGDYPGPPDSSTPFPSEYLIDYVRIYATPNH